MIAELLHLLCAEGADTSLYGNWDRIPTSVISHPYLKNVYTGSVQQLHKYIEITFFVFVILSSLCFFLFFSCDKFYTFNICLV